MRSYGCLKKVIVSPDVQSLSILYANLDSNYDFLLCIDSCKPFCILVSETWLKPDIPDSIVNIPNYMLFRCAHDGERIYSKHRGGGAYLYLLQSIFQHTDIELLDFHMPNIESLWLKINLHSTTFILSCNYRPGDTSHQDNLSLNSTLCRISDLYSNIIILGVFNCPMIKWSEYELLHSDNSEAAFIETITQSNLEQLITEPTRFRSQQTLSTRPTTMF